MLYKYNYALEKFNRAIHTLATHEGDVRKRLLLVFQGDLAMIDLKHLPQKLHNDYIEIQKTLTKYDATYKSQGRIEASLRRMRNSTGKKIAEKLFNICDVLNQEFYKR